MRILSSGLALMFVICMAQTGLGQPKGFNYDEAKVPAFELPDPLVMEDGSRVKSVEDWKQKRRPEILSLFQKNVYGVMPPAPEELNWKVFESSDEALDGIATRRQVTIYFTKDRSGPQLDLLLYLPNDVEKPVPAFVALNFKGNHTVHSDPNIRLATLRPKNGEPRKADESQRGERTHRWQVEKIVKAGYGIGTAYYYDIDPDYHDGFQNGVHALYPELRDRPDNFASISAWAWGLGRILDYFEENDDVDHDRVAVMGHSRLGKTSLWAGASDPRFALVISNDSGCGGAALSRRRFGETVKRINTSFPHWFCEKFKTYNDNEDALPVDQHMLIALMAPRPVYVASARQDRWADPKGEFLSARYASPVYRLFDKPAIPEGMAHPEVGEPVHTTVGYHIRSGKHDVTAYDWEQYIRFADRHLRSE